ncbi:hypothetical protein OPT61_g3075 [Boeremia exigua]|uniref:Uncharacterized protein n=1 Tax=Boeremia exigua TaxID=749465 RepID=A0ACC2IJC4_9PLEO|nr:hypothetical protein OPT61_g3075 [Boeremia exigua]
MATIRGEPQRYPAPLNGDHFSCFQVLRPNGSSIPVARPRVTVSAVDATMRGLNLTSDHFNADDSVRDHFNADDSVRDHFNADRPVRDNLFKDMRQSSGWSFFTKPNYALGTYGATPGHNKHPVRNVGPDAGAVARENDDPVAACFDLEQYHRDPSPVSSVTNSSGGYFDQDDSDVDTADPAYAAAFFEVDHTAVAREIEELVATYFDLDKYHSDASPASSGTDASNVEQDDGNVDTAGPAHAAPFSKLGSSVAAGDELAVGTGQTTTVYAGEAGEASNHQHTRDSWHWLESHEVQELQDAMDDWQLIESPEAQQLFRAAHAQQPLEARQAPLTFADHLLAFHALSSHPPDSVGPTNKSPVRDRKKQKETLRAETRITDRVTQHSLVPKDTVRGGRLSVNARHVM